MTTVRVFMPTASITEQITYNCKTATHCQHFARQLNMCSMCPPFCRTTNSIQRHHSLTLWRRQNFDCWW